MYGWRLAFGFDRDYIQIREYSDTNTIWHA